MPLDEKLLSQKPTRVRSIITDLDLKNPNVKFLYVCIYVLVFCFGILQLVPLAWMVSGSLQSVEEVYQTPPVIIPKELKFDNYVSVWKVFDFVKYTLNSLVLCGIVILLQITLVPLAAYVLAKIRPPFHQIIFICFLSTMMIPAELTMIPLYLIMKDFPCAQIPHLNFIDTYWPLFLPFAGAFNLFLYKSFFEDLPDDLIDAARIDGCSEFKIFFNVVVPLSKPVFAVVAIFAFMSSWRTYMGPLIYLHTKAKFPLMLAIATEVSGSGGGAAGVFHWNELMALSIISVIPMVIFFIFAQRYILRGISFTGMKW